MWWSSDTEIPDGIPSASELSVCGGDGLVSIISSLPHLETLRCIEIEHFTDPVKYIVHCITKRRRGVKAGREVDGVKMKNIKTLFIPFVFGRRRVKPGVFEQFRRLGLEVKDSAEAPDWKVEI